MSDNRQRLAALAGREFLPAARELRILMQRRLDAQRPLVFRIRPRTRLKIERWGAGICILAAIAAVLFL